MKISRMLLVACLATACSQSAKKQPAETEKEKPRPGAFTYVPFPEGYGYLTDSAELKKAVQYGNVKAVRTHAWKIWAGIMQPDAQTGWPLWYSWPNSQMAFDVKAGQLENAPAGAAGTETAGVTFGSLKKKSLLAMRALNSGDTAAVMTPMPVYYIPQPVLDRFPKHIFNKNTGIADGKHFLFNGDIMIATESLSPAGLDWIKDNNLNRQSVLNDMHQAGKHELNAPTQYIVTKHMYWPVPAKGLSAIPVWHNDFPDTFTGYAGYEKWGRLAAIDPSGTRVGQTAQVSYLHRVLQPDGKTPLDSVTRVAKIYGLPDFYHHRVTQKDWDSFDDADKAIINAASYWAYNKPFGPGDYLVTIAMHINTKEVPTWALQSAWWSDTPDQGIYAKDRPHLPQAKGPWKHYELVDAYGIKDPKTQLLPVGTNPYIELVSHPIATNCTNCHQRAGWPSGNTAGMASYQNPDCKDLLAPLTPASPCLQKILLSDFQWIIPDRAVADLNPRQQK